MKKLIVCLSLLGAFVLTIHSAFACEKCNCGCNCKNGCTCQKSCTCGCKEEKSCSCDCCKDCNCE